MESSDDEQKKRILEEWKSNVSLYIHHDNLKQSRLRHFLTIQAALIAFVGISTRIGLVETWKIFPPMLVFLLLSIGISLIGWHSCLAWRKMDHRAGLFTVFHRARIRQLENEYSNKEGGQNRLTTFTLLYHVLENIHPIYKGENLNGRITADLEKYYYKYYPFLRGKSESAGGLEKKSLKYMAIFWFAVFVGHGILFVYACCLSAERLPIN
jgi:hypothetical protein